MAHFFGLRSRNFKKKSKRLDMVASNPNQQKGLSSLFLMKPAPCATSQPPMDSELSTHLINFSIWHAFEITKYSTPEAMQLLLLSVRLGEPYVALTERADLFLEYLVFSQTHRHVSQISSPSASKIPL